jgi:hypothetical protein
MPRELSRDEKHLSGMRPHSRSTLALEAHASQQPLPLGK